MNKKSNLLAEKMASEPQKQNNTHATKHEFYTFLLKQPNLPHRIHRVDRRALDKNTAQAKKIDYPNTKVAAPLSPPQNTVKTAIALGQLTLTSSLLTRGRLSPHKTAENSTTSTLAYPKVAPPPQSNTPPADLYNPTTTSVNNATAIKVLRVASAQPPKPPEYGKHEDKDKDKTNKKQAKQLPPTPPKDSPNDIAARNQQQPPPPTPQKTTYIPFNNAQPPRAKWPQQNSQPKVRFGMITSYVIQGIESIPIRVEVSIVAGLSKLEIIGLPDVAIKESRERIVKSLLANGYKLPPGNITVNLSSAKIRKRGTLYDLPIVLGILSASKQIHLPPNLHEFMIAGELSLEGDVKRVEGLFTSILEHIENNQSYNYLIPYENKNDLHSIAQFKDITYFTVNTLREAVATLQTHKQQPHNPTANATPQRKRTSYHASDEDAHPKDFSEVAGHSLAKLALQLAAIHRLNVLFVGPPGSGKSMLMHRFPTILPQLSFTDALMVNRIYKAYQDGGEDLLTAQPFRVVHSTTHHAALIGGGRFPKPGEISLAHKGFLFLDELSEFDRTTLQSLRTPLDIKSVTISRVEQQVIFPCDFTLLACTNPCSCGYYGDPIKRCVCTHGAISRFYSKLSGPLVDRFDIMVYISKIDEKDFTESQPLSSAIMKDNVEIALCRKPTFKPLYQQATLKEIFKKNEWARLIIQKALKKEIISMRRVMAVLKIIYALELFYGRKMDKPIVMQALELARNKLEA